MIGAGSRRALSSPTHLARHRQDELGERVVVDRDRVARLDVDLDGGAVGGRDSLADAPDIGSDRDPPRLGDRPHRAAEEGGLGDDVGRRPGHDLGDRDDRRIERVDATGDHQLQGEDDLGGHGDRVDARCAASRRDRRVRGR